MFEKTVYVKTVTVVDPDTKLPVEIEIHKCLDSGAMVGIDGSYLATDIEDVRNPYNDGFLDIGDDE